MNLVRLGATVLVAASLSACATITRGTQQKFAVVSDPDGASVEMSNGMHCTTPCSLKLKRKSDFLVKVTKDGFEPAEVHVQGKMKGGGVAGGVVGNAIFGGVIGAGVDASNGSMLSLAPNPVNVTLKPLSQIAAPAAESTSSDAAPAASASTTPSGTPQR